MVPEPVVADIVDVELKLELVLVLRSRPRPGILQRASEKLLVRFK